MDLSEANKLFRAKTAGRPAYTDTDKNRFYGDIWLLEQVAAKTGLREDLNKVFEGNAEYVDSVLTLAYFSVCTPSRTSFQAKDYDIGELIVQNDVKLMTF